MLKKNDVVDIVSPSTTCNFDEIKKIKNYIKNIGLKPRIFLEKNTIIEVSQGSDMPSILAKTRFEQLKKSVENSESKIVWCTRGGYGSAEILSFLKNIKKPKTQKIFIGFSDISSLNIFLTQQWDWQAISAPMLLQLALKKVSTESEKAILDLIFGKTKQLKFSLNNLSNLQKTNFSINNKALNNKALTPPINSKIIGGCTSVIAGHFGTKNQINWDKKILFLEDTGEDGARLDRYFYQIATIIKETNKKPIAILLGNFLEPNSYGSPKQRDIKLAIKNFVEKIGTIPIFEEQTKCLGHSTKMLPIILGRKATITSDNFLIQNLNKQ